MTLIAKLIALIIQLGPEAGVLITDLEALINGTPGTPNHASALSRIETAVEKLGPEALQLAENILKGI